MAVVAGRPPVDEIGTEQAFGGAMPAGYQTSVQPWQTFVDVYEQNPALQWPNSIRLYQEMRTDSQIEALWYGSTLPIKRYGWFVDPNGAREEIVVKLAADLNLPIKGEDAKPRPRMKGRFSWKQTLHHILLSLIYGHMYFEQVGYIGEDGLWHIKKLAPRMPDTIQEIKVAEDGGLVSIKQAMGMQAPDIPVDRLVAYIWDKEGANWAGRSMLRSVYKDWVIKDRLIRVDANKNERNGMGVPVAEAPPNASKQDMDQLNALASRFRAGSSAGGAIPHDSKLTLQGTQGSLPDTLASIRARDEAMARRFLMMFMQLGQTETGSRALGGEFIDWFALAQEFIADFVVDVTTEHVCEDWVDWNYGEGEELTPRIGYNRSEDTQLAVTDLVAMVDKGVIVVDEELEDNIRAKYDLPPKAEGAPEAPGPTPPTPPPATQPPAARAKRRRVRRVEAAGDAPSPLNLPDRTLRRQPYEQELAAQTDFKELDKQWKTALDKLISSWSNVRSTQIAQLQDLITSAGDDLTVLSEMQADAIGADIIHKRLKEVAKQAAKGMVAEAERQGIDIAMPKLTDVNKALGARADAVDSLLARSLSESASRRAVSISGGGLTPEEVSADVGKFLGNFSDTWLRDQFTGAISAAQNAGRKEVVKEGPPSSVYASELLDENTCDECTAIDGTEYASLAEAEADYPTGGYMECAGGPRCRGTIVSVYDEAPAAE